MANRQEVKELKSAMEKAFSEQYPEHTISVFKRFTEDIELPAIIVNIPVFVPHERAGSSRGTLPAVIENNVFVMYSAADEKNEDECLQLSTNIANFINGNNWGLAIPPAKIALIEPVIEEGLEECIIQRIDYEQNLTIKDK